DDAYGDPGIPLRVTHPDGAQTVLADGTAIYLRGDGDTPDGKRPFLDRFDLATGATTRLHESPPGSTEHVLGGARAGRGPGRGGTRCCSGMRARPSRRT